MTNARIQHILSLIDSYGEFRHRSGFFRGINDRGINDIELYRNNEAEGKRTFNNIKKLLMEEKK